jgi:hypothetical protein
MGGNSAERNNADKSRSGERRLYIVCIIYLALSAIFASSNLDIDEFGFIRDPYELLGGDYTVGYVQQHNYAAALNTLLKSYYFYWKYRPLYSPIVSAQDKSLFAAEELRFGYVKPSSVSKDDPNSLAKYRQRLVVPEPDRFYSHGAGKPLLPAILSIPQLVLVKLCAPGAKNLLFYQSNNNYHPIFILTRLAQILSGLITIVLVYRILEKEHDHDKALFGAVLVALFPISIRYFPNLHHDSILTPLSLASAYFFYRRKYNWSGLFFGLALASKNSAVLLIPGFLALIVGEVLQARRNRPGATRPIGRDLVGFAKVMALGVLVLTPFANPISYAQEILTPLTHRQWDPRGQDVAQFTLSTQTPESPTNGAVSSPRHSIRLAEMLLRMETNDFFFFAIGCLLFWGSDRDRLSKLSFVILLCALPYGLVFGYGLNYRSLQFVPFFALVCAVIAPRRYLLALTIALLSLDALYCFDPIRTDSIHAPVNKQTFWGLIWHDQ